MKRLFKILFYIFVGLILALFLAPILFEDKLKEAIKDAIEKRVDAQVEFDDISMSFFSDLPYIHVSIDSLELIGNDPFENLPLYKSQKTNISTDWKSILKSKDGITIHRFEIIDADMFFVVDEEGKANYDISKSEGESSSNYFGNINAYALKECNIIYLDKTSDIEILFTNVNHSGKGAFENVVFDLITETEVEDFTVRYLGFPYIHRVNLKGPLALQIDLVHNKYTLKENQIQLNDIDLSALGSISILEDAIGFDLNVMALNNQVHEIISLLPYLMQDNQDILQSEGIASLQMSVLGNYKSQINQYPGFTLDLNIDNGTVTHKGLNQSINDIQLRLSTSAKEGNWDDLIVNVNPFSLALNEDKIAGRLQASKIYGNSSYEGQLVGTLDLAETAKILNSSNLIQNGKLTADIFFDTNKEAIISKSFNDNSLKGAASIQNLEGVYNNEVTFIADSLHLELQAEKSKIDITNLSLLDSELSGKLEITNPYALLLEDEKPALSLAVNGNKINLDTVQSYLMIETVEESQESNFENMFSSIDFSGSVNSLQFQDNEIENISLSSVITDESIQIDNAAFEWNEQKVEARGSANSWMGYMNGEDVLDLEMFVNTGEIDFNKLMPNSETETSSSDLKLPKDIIFNGYFESESLKYNDLSFNDAEGKISLLDGVLSLENMESDFWNGAIAMAGTLNTSGEEKLFDFRYKLLNIPFAQMFESSTLFQKLSPLSQYVDGVFNSTLVLSGPLDENLIPDIYKINASGFLETFNSQLVGLKPLEELANKLGIEKIKKWPLNDSRNWFDIIDGKVYFKEKDYELDDMSFKIAGNHSLDQNIDYIIKARIPRTKLQSNAIGKELDYSIENIEKAAAAKGIDIDLGDFIYFDISITGSLTQPIINIQPTGSGGASIDDIIKDEIDNRIETARDSLETRIEEEKDKLKDTVQTEIKKVEDSLKAEAQKTIDTTLTKVKDSVSTKLDSLASPILDSLGKQVKDKIPEVFGKQAQSEIDSIKAKINDWNPFKRKKG